MPGEVPEQYIKPGMVFRLRECKITKNFYNENRKFIENCFECLNPNCIVRSKKNPLLIAIKHYHFYYNEKRWFNPKYIQGDLLLRSCKYEFLPQINGIYRISPYQNKNDRWFSIEMLKPNPKHYDPYVPLYGYDRLWWHYVDWKINCKGIIKWKSTKHDILCHQSINNVDFRLVRTEFNILVVYFALKLKVLANRARKTVSARIAIRSCLLACHYSHRNSAFGKFAGVINYPIKHRIFAQYGMFDELKGSIF